MAGSVDAGTAFAEQLGQWLHFADAITLSAVHSDGIASMPTMRPDAQAAARAALKAEFDRVQSSLVNSIVKSCTPGASKAHISLPVPEPELLLDIAKAYLPYRRFYESHQRDMELSIQPLHANVRHGLARMSPGLRKLAELDGALEKMLRERESRLLAKVPMLLKKRFELLFKQHQQTLAAGQQADKPAAWMQAGGWLRQFCKDMQMLLQAEVELRLQLTMGLIEASNADIKQDTQ
jgi:hypothetical protein